MGAAPAQDEIENFVHDLQSVANRIRPRSDEEHVAVKLLAFSSKETGSADWVNQCDLEKYEHVFGKKFGFDIEPFIIPREDSATKLSEFLFKAEEEHQNRKGVLIVVYVGCGTLGHLPVSTHSQMIPQEYKWNEHFVEAAREKFAALSMATLPCWDPDSGEGVDWHSQQRILEGSAYNTLIILDTCDSGSASRLVSHNGLGSLEFLTACGFTGQTLFGPESFSATLCTTLEDMAAEDFTISHLYGRLIHRNTNLYNAPFYARLPGHGSEIRLQAVKTKDSVWQDPEKMRTILLKVNILPSQDGLDSTPWKDWIESYAPRNISGMKLTSDKACSSYCFSIRVRLMASSIPDYTLWRSWIDQAPRDLQSVTFDFEQPSLKSDEDSIASFVAQLNFNLGINESLGARYYQSVTVLPITWKKPTIKYLEPEENKRNDTELAQIRDELEGISEVSRDDYHYHVKSILELSADDSNDARCDLVDGINDLTRKHGRGTSSLLIVVYGGHGADTRHSTVEEGDCVWVANVSAKSAEVNWTTSGMNLLENAERDSLMVLDCCYSGSATRGVTKNTTEILAAATRNEPSWSGPRAYSKLLKRKLKEKSGRPFTAFELHEVMLAASKAPLSGDPNNLQATPDHGFTSKSRTTSILPKPLDQRTVQTITTNRPLAPDLKKRRIFLEVELDQLQGLEDCVSEWGKWFTKRHPPPNMCGVKFCTPRDIFVKAITERNALLKQWIETEDQEKSTEID